MQYYRNGSAVAVIYYGNKIVFVDTAKAFKLLQICKTGHCCRLSAGQK